VIEQVAGPFNADYIATDFAAKIMLGKPLVDVRFFKQSCHETLPHRIPPHRLAAILVEVAFAFARTKEPGGKINWAGGLGLFYGLSERGRPLENASSSPGIYCLVRADENSFVPEITHTQAKHISAANAD
jgi:hypothetical protein